MTIHEVISFTCQDVLVVCTSVGWTNEKHMLYLSLLEESFVSQLHDSKYSFKELFNHSPGACIHELSSKGHVKNVEAEQVEAYACFLVSSHAMNCLVVTIKLTS